MHEKRYCSKFCLYHKNRQLLPQYQKLPGTDQDRNGSKKVRYRRAEGLQQMRCTTLEGRIFMGLEWMVNAVMLAFCSIQDIREKEVSLWKLKVYGILATAISIWKLFSPEDDLLVLIFRLLAGLLPGIFLLILARITREAVGYGDGLILLFIGLSLGFWECIGIFFAGLLGIFLAAVLALLLFGRKKSLEIPFIPFLLTGLAGGYFWMKGYS